MSCPSEDGVIGVREENVVHMRMPPSCPPAAIAKGSPVSRLHAIQVKSWSGSVGRM
jgi:hypothetical protein